MLDYLIKQFSHEFKGDYSGQHITYLGWELAKLEITDREGTY